jgi:outer membrane autotransporter protein
MSFSVRKGRAGLHRREKPAAPRWRLMARRMLSRRQLLCGVALLALGSPAMADNIDTTPAWDGTNSVSPWGVTNTATYGQTITPVVGQTILTGFTFELARTSGTAPQFQGYVYQWDSVTNRIVGSALFASPLMTAPSGTGFTPVTINTGNVTLTVGQQYVLFLSTSQAQPQPAGLYKWGQLTNNTAYVGGQFVFNNNGANFASLSTSAWSSQALDLAFIAMLSSVIIPPPPPPPPVFLSPLLPAGAAINPTNVAAGIDGAIRGGATLPAGFTGLFLLTPDQLAGALNQLSGENNTQAQQGSFQFTNSFLSLLTDPFTANRGLGSAMGFAPERGSRLPPAIGSAYGMVTKAPPPIVSYAPRWDVWGAAFGGSNTTSGNPTVVGSHDTRSNVGGFATGADYRLAPDALIGFSLAGGATSWSLAGGFGGGRSDVFLAGLYGAKQFGAGYVSGAFSYSNYWMSTDRTVTVAGLDQLHADFNAQNFGGRLEGGYHVPTRWMAVQWTPYAAIQAQSFRTPGYGEVANAGSAQFALTYNGRTATAVRGELGGRVDKTFALDNGTQLNLFGKAAWAHDEISDPTLNVSFIGLPIASFAVNGATPAHDLALVTAGSEWRMASNVSLMAKFDGEFANRSQTYAGTARLRYTW